MGSFGSALSSMGQGGAAGGAGGGASSSAGSSALSGAASGAAKSGSKDSGSRMKKPASSAGKAMQDWANIEASNAGKMSFQPVRYKKGGRVGKRKSGGRNKAVPIIAHENERVIPADKRKKVERLMKRAGMKLTDKKRNKDKRKKNRKDAGRS